MIQVERYFTKEGVHPFDEITWTKRDVQIPDLRTNTIVFEQKDVEAPDFWSNNAVQIAASKYFYTSDNYTETSIHQLIDRIAKSLAKEALDKKYMDEYNSHIFEYELYYLMINQYIAFNSPVLINMGVKSNASYSACFINEVEDSIESIMDLAKTQARIYKSGAGSGVSYSSLRSSKETVTGGGLSSGPNIFLKMYDSLAASIRSGGKCFREGTLVSTPKGLIPIEKLKIGEKVLTHEGEKRIFDVMYNGKKQCYNVQTTEGYQIDVTQGHKFTYWDHTINNYSTKPIEEFSPGDKLYLLLEASNDGNDIILNVPTPNDSKNATTISEMTFPKILDYKFAYILGLLYGDDHIRNAVGGYIAAISFCKDPAGIKSAKLLKQYSKDLFNEDPLLLGDYDHYFILGFTRKRFVEFLEHNNISKRKADNLEFPEILYTAKPEVRASFIAGYLDADGCYQKRGGWTISSIDNKFLSHIQRLLLSLGLPSKIKLNRKAIGKWRPLYRFSVCGKLFVDKFNSIFEQYSAKVQYNYNYVRKFDCGWSYSLPLKETLKDYCTEKGDSAFIYDKTDIRKDSISFKVMSELQMHPNKTISNIADKLTKCIQITLVSVTPTNIYDTYDIEVEDVHMLCANGFYTSNSRRSARMITLSVEHPDIIDFINLKKVEEKKAKILIENGYSHFEATDSVFHQNGNNSVRVTDDFMNAVINDEHWWTKYVTTKEPCEKFKARDILYLIAQATHDSGDPALQFDTVSNDWNTLKNIGRIDTTNVCISGDTLIAVADGRNAVSIKQLVEEGKDVPVYCFSTKDGKIHIRTGRNPRKTGVNQSLFKLTLDDGSSIKLTPNHKVMLQDGSYKEAKDLVSGERLIPFNSIARPSGSRSIYRDIIGIDGKRKRQYRMIWEHNMGFMPDYKNHIHHCDYDSFNDNITNLKLMTKEDHKRLHSDRMKGMNNPLHTHMTPEWKEKLVKASQGENNGRWIDISNEKLIEIGKNFYDITGEKLSLSSWQRHAKKLGVPINLNHKARFTTFDNFMSLCGQTKIDNAQSQAQKTKIINTIIKIADYLSKHTIKPTKENWNNSLQLYKTETSSSYIITAKTAEKYFEGWENIIDLVNSRNHKVISIEQCESEDVYNLTVDEFHNYAVITNIKGDEFKKADLTGIIIKNCGEVSLPANSQCNLCAINVKKYLNNNIYDINEYLYTIRLSIIAQDLITEMGTSPNEKIAEMARTTRPLGLGITNLGALLMVLGFPYDSDEGRDFSAGLYNLLTSYGYIVSSELALHFNHFEKYDSSVMYPIIQKHIANSHNKTQEILNKYPDSTLKTLFLTAEEYWNILSEEPKPGFRNATISTSQPTGTVGFILNCSTTGIEPAIGLMVSKKLSSGGKMNVSLDCVEESLHNLLYSEEQIKSITNHISKNGTILGSEIQEKHLPIFECALGDNCIKPAGHIDIMAAIQPFISMSISKTVNCPKETTVEQIFDIYVDAWKKGLKAISIYRDTSKSWQPMTVKKTAQDEKEENSAKEERKNMIKENQQTLSLEDYATAHKQYVRDLEQHVIKLKQSQHIPHRMKLPDERHAITHKFDIAGHEGYVTVGLYDNGAPGELFIVMNKEGSSISGLMDSFATVVSMALQYGISLETLCEKFMYTRFEPAGITKNPNIRMTKSPLDYIFKWIKQRFLDTQSLATTDPDDDYDDSDANTDTENNHNNEIIASTVQNSVERISEKSDGIVCPNCGTLMMRHGTCYYCSECGTTTGCS